MLRPTLSQPKVYDVIVIGGGPAGLSAALYAARSNLRTVVLDKSPTAGALGMASRVENYPGIRKSVTGAELLSTLREQAEAFGAEAVRAQVIGVDFDTDPKSVFTADGVYQGTAVIVATGAMGRKPSIEGEAELIGRGVSYCAACDAAFFQDSPVAMVGKIEGILEEIGLVARFANQLYVVTPAKDLTPEQEATLESYAKAEVLLAHRVLRIEGETTVQRIRVAGPDGKERTLEVSGVFVHLHGAQPVVDYLMDALDTTQGCIAINKQEMSTSVDGVYAAGDVTCKKIRQVVIAAAEGCIAALSAERYLNNRQRVRSQWSSAG